MTFSARDLISASLSEIRVLGLGRRLEADDLTRGMEILKQMIDFWQTKRFLIYGVEEKSFTLTASDGVYTIGPSGDIVPASALRPVYLDRVNVIPSGDTLEQEVTIIQNAQYEAIEDKSMEQRVPNVITMFAGAVNNTVKMWPVPSEAATLKLWIPIPISQFATASTNYSFPDGYYNAFQKELARRMQRPFGKGNDPALVNEAAVAMMELESLNDDGPPEMPPSDVGYIGTLYDNEMS